jgi:hypothetical protein
MLQAQPTDDGTGPWRAGVYAWTVEVVEVRNGSYLAVPLTSGRGLLSGVKLKKEDQS